MRTSIDIPDDLMEEVRKALKAQNRTFRDAVIEGLRRTILADRKDPTRFKLRDATFMGKIGFAPGFQPEALTASLRQDAGERLNPGASEYLVHDTDDCD
ncbi:MAG: hypothetical protein WD397_02545 [Wenzhouxiangellaceae bacterium]